MTDDITKALADTRRDETPPADIEGRIVASLKAAGLVRPPRRPARMGFLLVASIAASLVLGVWIGVEYRRPSPNQSKFLLLLYEDATFDAQPTDAGTLEAEYQAWIRDVVRSGHAISGDKLAWGGTELRPHQPARVLPTAPAADTADGFFVVMASDEQAAIGVAETCPHLRHGGRIVVRPIDR